jgi:hypothetical protein
MLYSDKTVLLICSPLFCSFAERLARDFGRVLLYIPTSGSFVTMNQGLVGTGLEGVEKVDSVFGDYFDDVDLFCFVDLGHSDLQLYLESLGKRVFGARNGEELEVYRELCKKTMEKEGLPLAPWKMVTGMDALRTYLKANKGTWVKVDKWRGLTETFFSANYDVVMTKLDAVENDLGGFKNVAKFICEGDLPDKVEVGLDCYCVDGEYPSSTLVGLEVKDLAYCAEFVEMDKIPEPITRWTAAMAPYFQKYGYRGFFSNEIRIGRDKEPYMIDACCRAGSPPSELYQEFYSNICEIIWEAAGGVVVDPKPLGKFGAQLVLKSKWANGHWQPVEVPSQFANQVKLFNCAIIDGKKYVIPLDQDMFEIGAVVGWGDTLQAAIDHMTKAVDSIEGFGISKPTSSIDQAVEQIEELNAMGLPTFHLDKQPKSN